MDGSIFKSCGILRSAFLLTAAFAAVSTSVSAEDAPLITITKSDKVALGLNGISGADGAGIAQT
ncbi:MAG: hypothetical protein WCL08_12185, partial [Verrucomicrobiota bacterium]